MMNEDEISKKIEEVFTKLGSDMPPGWRLNEGTIKVKNEIYSVENEDQSRNQIKSKNEDMELKTILDEFTKVDNNLPPGWKLKGGSVKQNNEIHCIKRFDDERRSERSREEERMKYGKRRRLEARHEHSRRLDEEERSRRRRRLEETYEHSEGWMRKSPEKKQGAFIQGSGVQDQEITSKRRDMEI